MCNEDKNMSYHVSGPNLMIDDFNIGLKHLGA